MFTNCRFRIWDFSYIIRRPLGLVICVFLIWRLIGWPCLIGIVTVIISQVINVYLSRVAIRWGKARREATDAKIHKVSQVVESIRHLRWYGWQNVWLDRIMDARSKELHLRVIVYIWVSLINFTNTFASGMFPVVAFYAYTILAQKPLLVDVAFPALTLFNMLETSLNEIPMLYVSFNAVTDALADSFIRPCLRMLGWPWVVLKSS